jgi:hypothetical protein
MHQMTTLLWCPVKCSYKFRRTNAIIGELIWSSQATYMSVCITRRIMKFRTIQLQSVLLHYGNGCLWLTAAGSSGLLWNTAQGVQRVEFVLLLFMILLLLLLLLLLLFHFNFLFFVLFLKFYFILSPLSPSPWNVYTFPLPPSISVLLQGARQLHTSYWLTFEPNSFVQSVYHWTSFPAFKLTLLYIGLHGDKKFLRNVGTGLPN